MDIFLQAAAQVSEFPGGLVFHLVLVFALGAAAAMAVGRSLQRRPSAAPSTGTRLALAASLMFGLRLASLALALAAAGGLIDPLVLIPPYERAASALIILLGLWIIAAPRPQRLLDSMTGLAGLLVLVALGISWALWAQEARVTAFYNGTIQETVWEAAQIALLVAGLAAMGVLAIRRRPNWLLGTLFLALLLAGHIIHYLYPIAANVAGVERLFEIVAVPLLAALVFLRSDEALAVAAAPGLLKLPAEPAPAGKEVLPSPAIAEPSPDLTLARALAALATAADRSALAHATTQAIAHALHAPLGLLLTPDSLGGLTIASAYDRNLRRHVVTGSLDPVGAASGDETLAAPKPSALASSEAVAALRRGETATWSPGPGESGLTGLASPVGAEMGGPLLLAPLRAPDGALLAALGIAPPAGQAAWSAAQAAWLIALAEPLAEAWQQVDRPRHAAHEALAAALAERDAARQEATALRREADLHADQLQEVEDLRRSLHALQPQTSGQSEREAQLAAELEAAQAALRQAQAPTLPTGLAGQGEAEAQLSVLRANMAMLHAELEQYRASEAALQAQAEQAQAEATRLAAQLTEQATPVALPPGGVAPAALDALQSQLVDYQQQVARLRTELDFAHAELRQRQADDTAGAANAFSLPFADPEQGLAELLEALANAEARLTQQTAELAKLRQALAEGEAQRLAPPPAAPERPAQAADMEVITSLTQELRQPMSSIIGYADLLLSESVGLIGALQRKFLERIKTSSERMGVLLDDLMRVMDIDSGNLRLARESVDVGRVIDDALRATEAQYREKNLNLVCQVPPNLPPIQADRDALLQIFSHLLDNSGAASANDSEVRLTVQHETQQRPGQDPLHFLIISVSDTGGGIAPADQPRVFSRLYRADAPLIAGLGDNGMGLSIAKALVEGHGGRVWVISDPGMGSTFYVLLPLEGKAAKANGARADH